MTQTSTLVRRLGLGSATAIGLGAMLGAGVFSVFAPAAAAAGPWLMIGLGIAAVVALCNAMSTATLATAFPASGGTYLYGRMVLGPWWGFAAGWSFVVGKIASCAAMAMTFAAYAAPAEWQRPAALCALGLMLLINFRGVTKTAAVSAVLVSIVLCALVLVIVATVFGGAVSPVGLGGTFTTGSEGGREAPDALLVLQSAGLLFFAFAGYARIATLAEEVRAPSRTIPLAIITAFTIAVLCYAAIGLSALSVLGPEALAASSDPLVDTVIAAGWAWAQPIVVIGAVAGSLGALLALIAGCSRTVFAMAREDDLPRSFSAVQRKHKVPHRAEALVAVLAAVAITFGDITAVIAFSSFGVLLYYFVANLAALRFRLLNKAVEKRWRLIGGTVLSAIGAVGCAVLVVTLPIAAIVGGAAVLAAGLVYRGVTQARFARAARA